MKYAYFVFGWMLAARSTHAQIAPPPPPPPPSFSSTPTPTPLSAGGPAGGAIGTLPEPSVTSIQDFYIALKAITLWVLVFGIILGVLFLIIGGLTILTSRGDEQKLGTGKKTITWAMVGIILLVLAFAIVNIIARFFGVQTDIISPR